MKSWFPGPLQALSSSSGRIGNIKVGSIVQIDTIASGVAEWQRVNTVTANTSKPRRTGYGITCVASAASYVNKQRMGAVGDMADAFGADFSRCPHCRWVHIVR